MPDSPLPRKPAPSLAVDLVHGGGAWHLRDSSPGAFTLLVLYRGLHCPICKDYIETLSDLQEDFAEIGVEVVAASMDTEARARKSQRDWETGSVPLGYGLTAGQARDWGLYLSEGVKKGEPDLFSEPGLFLIRPDGTLYYAAINSSPWGRPYLPSFYKSVKYIVENDYPARGEVSSISS